MRCERSSTLASSDVERARAIGSRLSDVLSVGLARGRRREETPS